MQQPAINPNKSIALFCPSSPVADKNKVFQAQEYLEDK
jgi:muramoyltetrapeptide carboxypeptidase LdcA involved in peptidoglycan recycling